MSKHVNEIEGRPKSPKPQKLQLVTALDELQFSVPYGNQAMHYLQGILDAHYGFNYDLLSDQVTPELKIVIKSNGAIEGSSDPARLKVFLNEVSDGPGVRMSSFDWGNSTVQHHECSGTHYYVVSVPTVLWH